MTEQAMSTEYRKAVGDGQLHSVPDLISEPGRVTSAAGRMGALQRPAVAVRIVGSDPLSREGVLRFLQEASDVVVVTGTAPAEVVVAVIDAIGTATVKLLASMRGGTSRMVLVVGRLEHEPAVDAIRAGAVGIIRRRDVTRDGLRRLIRAAADGESTVPTELLSTLVAPRTAARGPMATGVQPGAGPVINDREATVLGLLADGADTREIARRLSYSERTVKTVIQDITQRFGLRNRSHAVAFALRQRWI